jgi:hydrogenase nickel incorporation protein HypB
LDADRIRETGVPAIQINTGKGCHPEVGHALERLPLPEDGVLFHRERGEPGVSVLVRSR